VQLVEQLLFTLFPNLVLKGLVLLINMRVTKRTSHNSVRVRQRKQSSFITKHRKNKTKWTCTFLLIGYICQPSCPLAMTVNFIQVKITCSLSSCVIVILYRCRHCQLSCVTSDMIYNLLQNIRTWLMNNEISIPSYLTFGNYCIAR
jgi:hypothetical protein